MPEDNTFIIRREPFIPRALLDLPAPDKLPRDEQPRRAATHSGEMARRRKARERAEDKKR